MTKNLLKFLPCPITLSVHIVSVGSSDILQEAMWYHKQMPSYV